MTYRSNFSAELPTGEALPRGSQKNVLHSLGGASRGSLLLLRTLQAGQIWLILTPEVEEKKFTLITIANMLLR